MIPVIIEKCSKIFAAKYFIKEFQTGNGIPDVVFAKKIRKRFYKKLDYESCYFLSELMTNSEFTIEDNLIELTKYKKIKEYLLRNKYIKK